MKARSAVRAVRTTSRRAGFRALLFLALAGAAPLAAQDSGYLSVRLDPNQSIRQVAEKYLDDPNLWPEILQASGLASITALRPGATLRIPATEISTANKALVDALPSV